MGTKLIRRATGGAYQVCSDCYAPLGDEEWSWEDEPRLYFCSEACGYSWKQRKLVADAARQAKESLKAAPRQIKDRLLVFSETIAEWVTRTWTRIFRG